MTEFYKSYRIIDGKPRWVIADTHGDIVNRNPTKEELEELEKYTEERGKYRISVSFDEKNFFDVVVDHGKLIKNPTKEDLYRSKFRSYNPTNVCPICRYEHEKEGKELINKSILYPSNACHEKDKNGKETGEWICFNHWGRYYEKHGPNSWTNIQKPLGDRRIDNLNPNSPQAKGDKGEDLLCEWKGYTNLNKKLDNYVTRRDCLDEKTGEYYQTKIAYYNSEYRQWYQDFTNLQRSIKEGFRFKNLFLFCISKDGNRVEIAFDIPEKEVIKRSCISVIKNPSRGTWYEKYRNKDQEELKIINEIWKKVIERRKNPKFKN